MSPNMFYFFQGYIRFAKEGGAQRAIDAVKQANDGKIMIRGVESTLRVLDGTVVAHRCIVLFIYLFFDN